MTATLARPARRATAARTVLALLAAACEGEPAPAPSGGGAVAMDCLGCHGTRDADDPIAAIADDLVDTHFGDHRLAEGGSLVLAETL